MITVFGWSVFVWIVLVGIICLSAGFSLGLQANIGGLLERAQ
jgi:hypothetical protein